MKNDKKGCFLRIFKDPSGERKDFVIEMGGEFDCFRIAVDFADLVTIKNEIINIEEREKELADIFIVLGGLLRWKSRVGNYIANNLLDKMPNEILENLLKAIDAKMEVNKERTRKGLWKKHPDGSYHH